VIWLVVSNYTSYFMITMVLEEIIEQSFSTLSDYKLDLYKLFSNLFVFYIFMGRCQKCTSETFARSVTFARSDTFARRHFSTSCHFCMASPFHELSFFHGCHVCTGDNFARFSFLIVSTSTSPT